MRGVNGQEVPFTSALAAAESLGEASGAVGGLGLGALALSEAGAGRALGSEQGLGVSEQGSARSSRKAPSQPRELSPRVSQEEEQEVAMYAALRSANFFLS